MSGPRELALRAREALASGERGLLAEIVRVEGSHYRRDGARMVLTEGGKSAGAISGGCLEADLARRLPEVCTGGRPVEVVYDLRAPEDVVWGLGLGCNGRVVILLSPLTESVVAGLEAVAPTVSLLVCGAGPDAVPLARLGLLLGWSVNIVAPRPTPAVRRRFATLGPGALNTPESLPLLARQCRSAAVVMTHNFLDDLDLLRRLARVPVAYLGILGPRNRAARLEAELRADGIAILPFPLHAPAGLDIGADSPEEIALAIAAEIQAALAGRTASFLRDRKGPIHFGDGEAERRAASAGPA